METNRVLAADQWQLQITIGNLHNNTKLSTLQDSWLHFLHYTVILGCIVKKTARNRKIPGQTQ